MAVYRLPDEPDLFPDPEEAESDGLIAVGGDLSPARLVSAYASGIFPWTASRQGPVWFSPDPRALIVPSEVHVSTSLKRRLRTGRYAVTADAAFAEVIRACAGRRRKERGTWITAAMKAGYTRLHDLGLAHSVEVREDGRLVGGLYGVSLGGAFFGESMFSARPDASKVALVTLCRTLEAWGFDFVDCQIMTPHLESLGAKAVPRRSFLDRLAASLTRPTLEGAWQLEAAPQRPDPAEE